MTELLTRPLCDGLKVDRLNKRTVRVAEKKLEDVIQIKKEEPFAHYRHVRGLIMDPAKTVVDGTLELSVAGLGGQDARLEECKEKPSTINKNAGWAGDMGRLRQLRKEKQQQICPL